jgi:hypothetical protein
MNNELVQLVVQLYEKNWGVKDHGLARAVVAMCMEEAAKACDALASDPRMYSSERRRGAGQCAAAIRALKDK